MTVKNTIPFSPLQFLSSLGAGGISIMPFAFFQYTHHTGKGLIHLGQMGHGSLPIWQEVLFYGLESVMIIFALIHFWLTAKFIAKLIPWIKTQQYKELMSNPLQNAAILAPFISLGMTFNVFIATVRFFIPAFAENLQLFMAPAFIGWAILWAALMRMEIKLLTTSFANSFDINKINFGWLLHPFALGMITVTGTGIAAMSKALLIAHSAAFMSSISLMMGIFLLMVKTNALFKSHFSADGLPQKQFLPSLLIVVPNITLFAISAFRMIHYFEHSFGAHLHWLAQMVIILSFAFETWYLAFGIAMLKPYFKNHFFNKEFHISQWGLICPFVAFSVLGSFFYKMFVPNPITYTVIIIATLAAIVSYVIIGAKNLKCARLTRSNKSHDCSNSLIPSPN
jgi:tellurite resistance protein TehA-like permease